MLAVQEVGIQYGARTLFRDVSFVVQPGERVAFAGPNGAGKSTMMKVIAGLVTPDSGQVVKARSVAVGYLPQEGVEARGRTLYAEAESAFAGVLELQKKLDALGAELAALDPAGDEHAQVLDRMGELQLRLEEADVSRIRPQIEIVLQGLGFSPADFERLTETFSGGWQMRIALAKLLLKEPDFLLLDEPTNHLDIDSLRWVENYLRSYRGGIVMISHDRTFLDNLIQRTLAFGNGRVEEYAGNYSFYERESQGRKELLERSFVNQQKQIAKTQEFIDRFRAKASKASQVQSRIKMLDKIERIEIESDGPEIRFRFPSAPASGHAVIKLAGVEKRYGDNKVLSNFDFTIEKGDRIAVVGVNGAGKSTFSRLVSLREEPTAGKVVPGHNVRISHFAQDQADELDPRLTALQTLEAVDTGGAAVDLRSILGCFLFRGDDVYKSVSVLSGGERSRLALAKMLLSPSNFLVLDEPTNHLDMASQARLKSALADYPGTFIIVSHNRDFLDPIVNKVLEFRVGSPPRLYLGNVTDYIAKKEQEESMAGGDDQPPPSSEAPVDAASRKEQKRMEAQQRQERSRRLKPLREEFEEVEQRIAEMEDEKTELTRRIGDPSLFSSKEEAMLVIRQFRQLEVDLEKLYTRWGDLSEEIERIEAEFEDGGKE